MSEFDIRGMQRRAGWPVSQPERRTDLPAPKRTSPLDSFTVPQVVRLLNLWSAYRRGDLNEGQ